MRSIYELSDEELRDWLARHGEPAYRARQILQWVYAKRAGSFQQMTSLPRRLRAALAEVFSIGPLPVISQFTGRDSAKLLVELSDGQRVECVAMHTRHGVTACVSCQVGCPVGCAFCASGVGGLVRNLHAAEIVSQLITLAQVAGDIRNVVFMGMGEPLLNYQAVLAAVRTITSPDRMGISPRHVTVGTAGIVPVIPRLAHDAPRKLELAVSLGAPVDELRRQLMPGVSKWSIAELLNACDQWTDARGGQPVTYAYVLIAGINDSLAMADRLAGLLAARRHHINLIRMNPVEHCDLRPSSKEQTLRFAQRLEERGMNVSIRRSRGRDVRGACGQLRRSSAPPPNPRPSQHPA